MEQRKFVFIKEFTNGDGKIPLGSELILFRNTIYLNGGMIHPAYQAMLKKLITNDDLRKEYLRETKIIHNKI